MYFKVNFIIIKVAEDYNVLFDEEGCVLKLVNLLHVQVTELLNNSPGVVSIRYRIDIYTKDKDLMSSLFIENYEDMCCAIGKTRRDLYMYDDIDSKVTVPDVLRHVVTHRIGLNKIPYISVVPLIANTVVEVTGKKVKEQRTSNFFQKSVKDPVVEAILPPTFQQITQNNDPIRPPLIVMKDKLSDIELFKKEIVPIIEESRMPNFVSKFWIRLFSSRHMISGRKFSSMVMLTSDDTNIYNDPNSFFTSNSSLQFENLNVVFKCNDLLSKKLKYFCIPGKRVLKWLPFGKNHFLDLGHSVRRIKFGQYLISNLRLKYNIDGDYRVELFNMM